MLKRIIDTSCYYISALKIWCCVEKSASRVKLFMSALCILCVCSQHHYFNATERHFKLCCGPFKLNFADSTWRQHTSYQEQRKSIAGSVDMSDPAAQALQPRLLQAQSAGSAGSSTAATGSGSGNSDPARPGLSQQQRASQKKAQVRAFPRAKKLEKLGVFSACKVASVASQSSPQQQSTSR